MPRLEYQNPNPRGGLEGGQLKTYRKSNVSVMLLWEAAFTPHSHHSCSSCIHLHREVVPETGGALTIIIVAPREGGTHKKVEQDNYLFQSNYWLPGKGGTDFALFVDFFAGGASRRLNFF